MGKAREMGGMKEPGRQRVYRGNWGRNDNLYKAPTCISNQFLASQIKRSLMFF